MAKFTVHLDTALKLIPHLVLRPQAFSVQSVSPLTVEIVHPDQDWVVDTINLLCRKDPTIKATQPTDQWGYFDDMAFPLTSPADLREGSEPASNLNLWEDATHQITFDGGKHWTNVILEEGNPEYYVACSDGKRSWLVNQMTPDWVVSRPLRNDREYQVTVTGRISNPRPQPVGRLPRAGLTHGRTVVGMADGRVEYRDNERTRQAASVGESPACDYTDTCFDSDPSGVGE